MRHAGARPHRLVPLSVTPTAYYLRHELLGLPRARPTPPRSVVIVGAGLAGLTVALHLADRQPVVLLAKRGFDEAATPGPRAASSGVLGNDDSVELHVRDTQDAGAGLVDKHAARFIAENSAEAIEWLVEQGVPFTTTPTGRSACT